MNRHSNFNVLGIIPARGGSKSIPKKNIKPLAGKPLIAYTIEAALQAKTLDRVIVSTDDEEIAQISRELGAEVPFMRPKHLAEDDVPDLPVLRHAALYLLEHENWKADIIVHLRATQPLRIAEDIDNAVNKLISENLETVRTVCKVEYHPYWMKVIEGDKIKPFMKLDREYFRRQDLPPVYKANGVVDVTRWKFIVEENRMYGDDIRALFMPEERSLEIDTLFEFEIIECLMEKRSSVAASKNCSFSTLF